MLLELLSTVLIKGYSHLCGSVGNLIVVEITIELLLVECCHHVMYLSCRSLSVALYSTRTLYCIVFLPHAHEVGVRVMRSFAERTEIDSEF